MVERLLADLPGRTTWHERLEPEAVARELDESTVLVLPSRSEGMGRVVVEAQLRGRAVVASRVGGLPDLVAAGENGLLVEPGDMAALADALVAVLADPDLAGRLGTAARAAGERRLTTPDEYAGRLRALVEEVLD